MATTSIGLVEAVFAANTKTFDASVKGSTNQLKAAQLAAEQTGNAIAAAGTKIDRATAIQERAADRARAAWQRELIQQDRAAQAEAETGRAKELAALKTDILTRATASQATAQGRLNMLLGTGNKALQAFSVIGVGFGIGIAVESLKRMVGSTIEVAVQLNKMHEQTGIATEDLSVLRYAAAQSGVEFDTLARGFKRLAVTVYDADSGNKTAAKGFAQLGISIADLKAKGNDMYAVLAMLADKFQQMPDGITKSDTAAKIFGTRMGSEMIPVLNQGAAAIENFKSKAPIFTDNDIAQLEKAHQATVDLDAAWQGLSRTISVAFTPALTAALGVLKQVLGGGNAITEQATRAVAMGRSIPDEIYGAADPSKIAAAAAAQKTALENQLKNVNLSREQRAALEKQWDSADLRENQAYFSALADQITSSNAKLAKARQDLQNEAQYPLLETERRVQAAETELNGLLSQQAYAIDRIEAAQRRGIPGVAGAEPGERPAAPAGAGAAPKVKPTDWPYLLSPPSAYVAAGLQSQKLVTAGPPLMGVGHGGPEGFAAFNEAEAEKQQKDAADLRARAGRESFETAMQEIEANEHMREAWVKLKEQSGEMTKLAASLAVAQIHGEAYAQYRQAFVGATAAGAEIPGAEVARATGNFELQAQQDRYLAESNTALGQFMDKLRETVQEFTNLGDVLGNFTIRTLESFNETLIKVLSTPASMMRGRHPWDNLGASVAESAGGAALRLGEGELMKGLGNLPGLGKLFGAGRRPTGAAGDAIHTIVDNNQNAGGIAAQTLALAQAGSAGNSVVPQILSVAAGFIPHFAEGGMMPSNMPAIVGENGPELFLPSAGGRIVPNDAAFGGGSPTINIDNRGNPDPAASAAAMHRVVASYLPHIRGMAVNSVLDYNRRVPPSRRG
jgi:hypothetical protein